MKRIVLLVVSLVAVVTLAFAFAPKNTLNADFLRIHVRADSNLQTDQDVKYVVKSAVVQYLAPHLTQATTKARAMQIVSAHLDELAEVCNQTLRQQGKTYCATVSLCQETFPTRTYNGTTLPSGVYDALIIRLGSGSGNNWWCVVYPPLCFVEGTPTGNQGIVYKSKLLEIISQWNCSKHR